MYLYTIIINTMYLHIKYWLLHMEHAPLQSLGHSVFNTYSLNELESKAQIQYVFVL